jgi:uncharacterized paraquat-inducible protein A
MKEKPCRDCGYLLDAQARGCPRCAMNVEAERMIDRVVAAVFLIATVIVAGGIGLIYFGLR